MDKNMNGYFNSYNMPRQSYQNRMQMQSLGSYNTTNNDENLNTNSYDNNVGFLPQMFPSRTMFGMNGSRRFIQFINIPLTLYFDDLNKAYCLVKELSDNRRLARSAIEQWMKKYCMFCKIYTKNLEIKHIELNNSDGDDLYVMNINTAFTLNYAYLENLKFYVNDCFFNNNNNFGSFNNNFGEIFADYKNHWDSVLEFIHPVINSLNSILLHLFPISNIELETNEKLKEEFLLNVEDKSVDWDKIAFGCIHDLVCPYSETALLEHMCLITKNYIKVLKSLNEASNVSNENYIKAFYSITVDEDIFSFLDIHYHTIDTPNTLEDLNYDANEKKINVDSLIERVERDKISTNTSFYVYVENGVRNEKNVVMECNVLNPLPNMRQITPVGNNINSKTCHAFFAKKFLMDVFGSHILGIKVIDVKDLVNDDNVKLVNIKDYIDDFAKAFINKN